MVTIHLVTVWNFHTNNQSPYETCSYQIILCSIWIIFIPLTCHHLNIFHTKQILKNFHTTYQSPYEMLSYGDNSYGDGLIGFTILGAFLSQCQYFDYLIIHWSLLSFWLSQLSEKAFGKSFISSIITNHHNIQVCIPSSDGKATLQFFR